MILYMIKQAKLYMFSLTFIPRPGSDEEGIPSSVNYFPNMSFPLPREILRCCCSKFFTPSMVFAHNLKARLLLSHQQVDAFDETAGFTSCYNLLVCSHSSRELLCHRASTLEFLHQLPVSYRASWYLLGLDFHQLAINGLLGTQIKKPPKQRLKVIIRNYDQ